MVKVVNLALPEGIKAVCCGAEGQSSQATEAKAVFVGFHQSNQLLFALIPLTKAERGEDVLFEW